MEPQVVLQNKLMEPQVALNLLMTAANRVQADGDVHSQIKIAGAVMQQFLTEHQVEENGEKL